MKKSIFGAATVALIAPLFLGVASAHADTAQTAQTQTTNATVIFEGTPAPVLSPVDPTNPINQTPTDSAGSTN